ncbi:MAG: insulinase family protein, partial [Phycisphaerales bacterium]|nr:insulinase family protein [Phycisphaerales bacterium]
MAAELFADSCVSSNIRRRAARVVRLRFQIRQRAMRAMTVNLETLEMLSRFGQRSFAVLLLALPVVWLSTGCAPQKAGQFAYRQVELDNGLKVITLEDHSCPVVAVHLWYHVGSKDENPERQGFAHMFEHMMFRGTDKLGPTDHFDLIRQTGGNCNAYTTFDQTVYVQTLPANQLELALWLESERMSFLKIDQTSFDTERKVVEEERRLGVNRPYGTVLEKVLAEVFQVHPYRWSTIGNIGHLRASSVAELRDFWTRYYVPNNATLVIVGDVKHNEAQALARKCFGWIPRYPDPQRITTVEPPISSPKKLVLKEENTPAPVCGIMFRTVPVSHDDTYALQMLAMIVGGGESSRVYRDLVAEKQTAVMAGAAAFSIEQAGFFAVGAVMTPWGGKLDAAQQSLEQHLERIRNECVTEAELTKARNQMLSGLVTENLTVVSKASVLGAAAVLEGDVSRVNRRIDRIRAVTPADLQRVAREYLKPERSYVVRIESNLLGSIFGKKKNTEEDAPITATAETNPPPPGRAGLTRPANRAAVAPLKPQLPVDPTPKFVSRTLPNGIKVMVVENHEIPYVSASLNLRYGAFAEAKTGAASMACGMLTKGTSTHTDAQLSEELEMYAISLGASADADDASVNLSCVSDQVDRGMKLMGGIVRTPTFPDDEFEKLRKQVRTGLAISSVEPGYVADRELRRRLYGDAHPYSRTGTGELADVDALSVADARDWWKKHARPDAAVLIFAGDIAPSRAYALAEATFGDWKAEGPLPPVNVAPIPAAQATHIYLVDKAGSQSQIRLAAPGMMRSHPGYFTSRMVSDYFGGAFSSRLNETIRVKKGLTYGASGGFSAARFGGSFRVSTFSKTEGVADAVQTSLDEIQRLRNEAPSDKELAKARDYFLGSFAGQRETPQAVAGDLWLIESENLPADYLKQLMDGVSAATPEKCVQLAR